MSTTVMTVGVVRKKLEGANPASVEELILDGHKIKSFTEEDANLLGQCTELKTLCLNQTYLLNLSGFPYLPKLEVLELTDNKLGVNSGLDAVAEACPKLNTLILAGNRLTDLSFVKRFALLEVLDVEVNPITASKKDEMQVRASLFNEFPNLKIVNSHDRTGNAIEEDDSGLSSEEESDSDGTGEPQIVGDDVEMM
eukprot:Gregarina_sp_Poly_1__6616@NODE_3553_length_1011_cov_532_477754_g2255_i0_p1_GENE_NODE_3553_length_1011_cov_532_477754_g2255_i0NODE_3553_length_1011_cov_532_477754_g2255_i0_p1_ORF_typecomplete_len196_score40_90LRR_9/PF14580_6/5LRR_9/PF14580_6/2_3e18LRR_4/PF12799_7/22LRR_4/PF12799_7/0_03LRR_4/PF12799_7/0_00034LRR_4/PF12799_7/2e03LRR_8/PF13855_6/0_00041LRR_8/PF13855_6/0_17LRR_8/PF13855_6/0_042LRR_6/PF13516_6/1_3e04LRR_6/PF13516_6/5_5e03LRR_6/PF13516_6/49LRR_6/PF13516_6/1_5LRR_6/PF13516_6/1_2e03_NODE